MFNNLFYYFLIQRSGYFDKRYYLENYSDVRQAGVNPLRHFVRFGWKEGRNPSRLFDTKYYLNQNKDVQAAGINPLVHYLRYGIIEKRACLPPTRYAKTVKSDQIVDNPVNQRGLLPVEYLLNDGQTESHPPQTHDTAVILHVFYPEIFQEIALYLSNLDGDFDLYVSIPDSNAALAKDIFAIFPHARIILSENRGRDVAPFLSILNTIRSLGYDYLLKLHTKQSPHRRDGERWRKDVYEQLVGSRSVVNLVKNKLKTNGEIGIIGPKGHVLNNTLYLGGNKANLSLLAYRAGILDWQAIPFSFVAGTMFWAKPAAFKLMDRIDLNISDFESEPIDADGALVHGVERFFGLAAMATGLKILEVDKDGQITEPSPNHIYQYAPIPQYHQLSNKLRSIVFFSAYKEEYAIEYLRITSPFRRAGIEIIPGVHNGEVKPEKVFLGDAVIFQREFPLNLDAYTEIMRLAKQAGKPVIYEIDDLLFSLPERHPESLAGAYTSSLMPMLLAVVEADVVTVPTKKLEEYIRGFNQHVAILPNYLDDSIWSLRSPILHGDKDMPVKIGYMGSDSHRPDLEFIAPALIKLVQRYPGRIQIWIWGTKPPESLRTLPEVNWIPSPSNNYQGFVRYFQTQSADIFIAPLVDNSFNQCKSPLKFFEYSALGIAGVYSKVTPYIEVITHGQDGLLASTPEEWLQHLIKLVDDSEYRYTLANNAQNTVGEKWLLSNNIRKWYEFFDHLNELAASKEDTKPFMTEVIKSITQQQHQRQIRQQSETATLHSQLNTVTAELRTLNEGMKEIQRQNYAKLANRVQRVTSIWQSVQEFLQKGRNKIKGKTTNWIQKIKRRVLLPRDTQLVQQSGFFNEEWYLEEYPDVAAAKINPIRHYILYGGFEGRDPGLLFNSSWYLDTYPDVRKAGINPLVHYLRFGKTEFRFPMEYMDFRLQEEDMPGTVPVKVLQASELVQLITQAIKYERYIISVSHNDYLTETTGGVQVYIAREQKKYFQKEISYFHIFPNTFNLYLLEDDARFLVGINLDGEYLGVSEVDQLLEALTEIDRLALDGVHIHHLMGFNIHAIQQILEFSNHRAEFWLHDFFSLCPSYHLLRNEIEYCGAPNVDSNACSICKYGEWRKQQQPTLHNLFAENDLQVIAPSNFAIRLWQDKFPYKNIKSKVVPLLSINWKDRVMVKKGYGSLRIGYIGFPLEQKGWKTWMNLTEVYEKDDRYSFYQFSSVKGTPGNYKRIPVAVTPGKPTLMIDSLMQEEIDVALLWSIVPETFSFTLHEALAAGCFIITNKKSGNIQDFLRRFPQYGVVLDGDADLIDLLSGDGLASLVKEYQKDGKPIGELIHDRLQE